MSFITSILAQFIGTRRATTCVAPPHSVAKLSIELRLWVTDELDKLNTGRDTYLGRYVNTAVCIESTVKSIARVESMVKRDKYIRLVDVQLTCEGLIDNGSAKLRVCAAISKAVTKLYQWQMRIR